MQIIGTLEQLNVFSYIDISLQTLILDQSNYVLKLNSDLSRSIKLHTLDLKKLTEKLVDNKLSEAYM